MAEAHVVRLDDIERIDRSLTGAEKRRNSALRELDRHRAAAAALLRQALEGFEGGFTHISGGCRDRRQPDQHAFGAAGSQEDERLKRYPAQYGQLGADGRYGSDERLGRPSRDDEERLGTGDAGLASSDVRLKRDPRDHQQPVGDGDADHDRSDERLGRLARDYEERSAGAPPQPVTGAPDAT
jgi:hypothetical protein